MTVEKRPYEKKRRAELEAETRRRITETAVELHGTIGPSRTSISAIAERAGVRRSTVYRHFPDEAALFAACSSHWAAANPLPDIARWQSIEDPDERLRTALGELYGFYRRTEGMMDNLLRDERIVPLVGRLFGPFHEYLAAARDVLVGGRSVRGRRRDQTRAATGHALAYTTWRSLTREQELDDAQAAELMCRFVAEAARRYSDRPMSASASARSG
jgi:AcrR family transcriptional regulator